MPKSINFLEKSYLTSYSPYSNCLCLAPNHAAVGISFNVFSYDAMSGQMFTIKLSKSRFFTFLLLKNNDYGTVSLQKKNEFVKNITKIPVKKGMLIRC